MKKKAIIVSIVLLLISLLSLTFFIKDNNTFENVKIQRDKTFAIMVQNEDKTGYIESTSKTWPSDRILNKKLTNCVDENGNEVSNPFSYENGIITVRTSKKVYCYLYFDVYPPIGEYLLSDPTRGLNTTLEGGLYRYQGASGTVDNYICFGTSDKDTCLSNPDAYIYRIIGIASDGRIKVMKNYALNTTYYWHNTYTSAVIWQNSDLYKGLNGISGGKYSNLFIGNTTYMPSGWEDKIETTIWKYGDVTSANNIASALYNSEDGMYGSFSGKIGLIYMHDYAYAYQSGGLNCSSSGSYSTCKLSWMFISNCDSGAPKTQEWTMVRSGYSDSKYWSWMLTSNGYLAGVNWGYMSNPYSVRPVFFLKTSTKFIGGTGTSVDPFMIS